MAGRNRAGMTGVLLVGQVLRQSGGNANPALVSQWCRSGWGVTFLTIGTQSAGNQ